MDGLGGSSQRYRAQDREIEQRYANLLTPIRDLTKNFEVDIAAYLDQYLGELSQIPITYQEGEATINFTQAAFLIQGSAFVYGKKVEYLHTLVHKMAGEIARNSLKDHDSQDPSKEGAGPATRRRKEDMQFMMHEDTELADSLDDLPSPRQAARNQAAAQRNQFRRQRRRPLSMVVFDTEKETKLYDLKADVVGFKVDYRLYTGLQLAGYESPAECGHSQECGRYSDGMSGCASPMGCTMDSADDCAAPGSPLPEPECPDMVPFSGEIGAFEECPAKPDVEETDPLIPLPQERQSTPARRIKEERIEKEENIGHPFIVIRRLLDPLEEVTWKNRPILVRRRVQKRPFDQCNSDSDSASSVITPVAAVWIEGCQYPHLLPRELRLQKADIVLAGGERFLKDSMKILRVNRDKSKVMKLSTGKEGFEPRASDEEAEANVTVPDYGADIPDADADAVDEPGTNDLPVEDADLGLVCNAGAALSEEGAQGPLPSSGPPSSTDSEKDSYAKLVQNFRREFHEPLSECQLSDLQKRVVDWEARIRPLLDIEEEREGFNIRTYCSRVLDHFSDAPSKQTLPFRQICQGQPVWEVPRYFASTLQLANNYNVELGTDGVMEEGMDTLHLTLLSRKQHFHELEEFDSNVSATPSQPTSRKGRQQGRKRPPAPTSPEDPSDVLREDPVVPDPDVHIDSQPPSSGRSIARAKSRMRIVASLAEDSSEGEDDGNMVVTHV